ncbi:MAG TPA: hypothetical protein VNA30_06400 [Mycobacteriales bacterium]|nr:hypothetical protein [Mycobacteriales bacterium]
MTSLRRLLHLTDRPQRFVDSREYQRALSEAVTPENRHELILLAALRG